MKKLLHAVMMTLTAWFGATEVVWAEDSIFIDVRSQAEYDQGHIEGALLMPHDRISDLIAEAGIARETPITLYCRSGHRAGIAKATLEKLGYTNVINAGGYAQLAQKQRDACKTESC